MCPVNRLLICAFSLCCLGFLAVPQGSAQESGAIFKRVKPPAPGTTKRLTIQIEKTWPYETDPPASSDKASNKSDDPTEPQTKEADWFWSRTGLGLEDAGPQRIEKALSALNASPQDAQAIAPNGRALETLVKQYGATTLVATAGKRVSPALVMAVILVESSGRKEALSEKGAQGLMQLMPATALRFNVTDVSDPQDNIRGGAAYLDWLLGTFGGDPLLTLAAYNAGENAVRKHAGVPPFAETRAYVPKVLAAWDRVRLYCQSLPRYVDDGCVFDLSRSINQ